jgi:putative ATP-dependent endonuclease of OLD family
VHVTGPSIRIADVRIQDFRAIGDLHLPLSPRTTVLLGMNNVGKTAVLEALNLALGSGRARPDDIRADDGAAPPHFEIDVRIEPASGDTFGDAVVQIVGNAVQINAPEFFVIRTRGTRDAKGGDPSIARSFIKGWGTTRAAAAALDEHPAPVTASVRSLLTYEMLDARRDGIEQLRNRRTFWGRAVADLEIAETVRGEIGASLRALQDKVLDASAPLRSLQDHLRAVAEVLGRPNMAVSIAALPTEADALLRSMDLLLSETGQVPLPLGAQGMGTRSLAALVIFRAYVHSILGAVPVPGTHSIAGFEEPEAHLHPQGQRAVLALLDGVPGQHVLQRTRRSWRARANLPTSESSVEKRAGRE